MNASHTRLQEQQQVLLHALFARPRSDTAAQARQALDAMLDTQGEQSGRGLMAYAANGHALAERTLLTAYPVIAALLDGDNFAALARDLWHRHPPNRGDLAHWGNALPDLLANSAQLADTPYLADVARTEWAMHCAAGAADAPPDLSSFARLASEDPEGLALTLAPGTTVIRSRHPVATLVLAHLHQPPSLAEAASRLREGVSENALVWRQGMRPRVAHCSPAEAALLRCLQSGGDLPQALDAAADTETAELPGTAPVFDFSSWLTHGVSEGLVLGVHDLAPTSTPPLKDSP